MGIFDFFRKRNRKNTVQVQQQREVKLQQTTQVRMEQPEIFGENGPSREYTYVRVTDRKNRYELLVTEDIVNDASAAETYEEGLVGRDECYDNMICPNCGVQLEKIPKLKGKCPHCKESLHVVKSYMELDKFMLLTTQERDELKKRRNMFFKLKQISKDLNNLGITKMDYDRVRGELDKTFSYRDVIWRLLNDKSLDEFINMRIGLHSNVHRMMGAFLEDEGKYRLHYNNIYI